MKVLHINYSDYLRGGGSAIAMHRLHTGLCNLGIDSKILCGSKTLQSDDSIAIPRNHRSEYLLGRVSSRLGLNDIHCISSFDITKLPVYKEADILNFHLIHSGFFNYLAIAKLTQNKPAVFTLHDMWAFTGHCAYSYDCDRWKVGCGKCPALDVQPSVQRDATAWEWKLKQQTYSRSNLAIVADSTWLAALAQESMLKSFPILHIPYGLDTEVYRPLDKQECRNILGINQPYVLMFSAVNLVDKRKGGDLLVQILAGLPASLKSQILLLVLGEGGDKFSEAVKIPSFNLGYVSSDRLKAIAYSASDLFLFPTRLDAFGIVAQEAAACGTPTVGFNVGGVSDIVRTDITGYLAQSGDIDDFQNGIVQILENESYRQTLNQRCRKVAVSEYALELQAKRYTDLYQQRLQSNKI